MKRQSLMWAVIAVVLLAGIGLAIYLGRSGDDTITVQQALALPRSQACLANDKSVSSQVATLPGLGADSGFWTSHIRDIPAGTSVDIQLATYDGDKITGSLMYPGQYGHYNFVAEKSGDTWKYTDFTGCQMTQMSE